MFGVEEDPMEVQDVVDPEISVSETLSANPLVTSEELGNEAQSGLDGVQVFLLECLMDFCLVGCGLGGISNFIDGRSHICRLLNCQGHSALLFLTLGAQVVSLAQISQDGLGLNSSNCK